MINLSSRTWSPAQDILKGPYWFSHEEEHFLLPPSSRAHMMPCKRLNCPLLGNDFDRCTHDSPSPIFASPWTRFRYSLWAGGPMWYKAGEVPKRRPQSTSEESHLIAESLAAITSGKYGTTWHWYGQLNGTCPWIKRCATWLRREKSKLPMTCEHIHGFQVAL
jgi:hypothetical protein